MQYEDLLRCRPAFGAFCRRYEGLLPDRRQRPHLRVYLLGLLGPSERKTIEPIALEQETKVRTLQHFIGGSPWDDRPLLTEHRRHVTETLGSPESILILDSTGFPKRGDHSVGVARQYCPPLGKTENCQVAINLSYASERGHAFLDRRLYLPDSWTDDPMRCRAAGIPDDVVFRPDWMLAYEMIRTARVEQVPHAWITGDEEFGKTPPLHDWLSHLGERWIFDLPRNTRVWFNLPRGRIWGQKGLLARLRELRLGRLRRASVEDLAQEIPRRVWQTIEVRDASKGPIVVQAVAVRVRFHRYRNQMGPEGWLVLSETVDQRRQLKFFESNAARECSLAQLLHAAHARWPIEQDHGQGKNDTGLGDYETRTWPGWHHHTALSIVAHHFLVMQRNRLGEKMTLFVRSSRFQPSGGWRG